MNTVVKVTVCQAVILVGVATFLECDYVAVVRQALLFEHFLNSINLGKAL